MLRLEQRQRSFCWFATWCAVPCQWKVQRECTSARVFAPTGNQSINQSWEEANLKFFTAFLTTEAKRGKDAKDSKKKEGPEGAELATQLPTGGKAIRHNHIQPGAALRSSSRPSNPQPVAQRLCTGSWRPQWLPLQNQDQVEVQAASKPHRKGIDLDRRIVFHNQADRMAHEDTEASLLCRQAQAPRPGFKADAKSGLGSGASPLVRGKEDTRHSARHCAAWSGGSPLRSEASRKREPDL